MIPEAPAVAAPVVEAPPPPAPTPAPETLSATEQAVVNHDPVAYKAARHAERFPSEKPIVAAPEKPVEKPVETPTAEVPPVGEPPARQLSRRQQDANEATRRAVDLATADLRAQLAAVQAQLTPPAPRQQPATDPEPDVTNKETYPDGQFDPKFIKDLASWQTRQDLKAYGERTAVDARQHEAVIAFTTRAAASKALVQAAITADPKALEGIDARLHLLKPTLALAPGEPVTFGNVVADWICTTKYPVQLLHHLSDRAEQDRLSLLPDDEFLREQGRLEAGFATPVTPSAPAPPAKLITEAPDPAATLGTRPLDAPDAVESAVRENNFLAYSAAKKAKGLLHYAG